MIYKDVRGGWGGQQHLRCIKPKTRLVCSAASFAFHHVAPAPCCDIQNLRASPPPPWLNGEQDISAEICLSFQVLDIVGVGFFYFLSHSPPPHRLLAVIFAFLLNIRLLLLLSLAHQLGRGFLPHREGPATPAGRSPAQKPTSPCQASPLLI